MARRQGDKIMRLRKKERAADDEQSLGTLLRERSKGGRNLAFVAGSKPDESLSVRACRRRHVVDLRLCGSIVRVCQQANEEGIGHQVTHESELLRPQRKEKHRNAGGVAAGTVETGHKSLLDGIAGS